MTSQAPAPPIGLIATPASGGASLSWLPNTESDLSGYRVYAAASEAGPYSQLGSALPASTTSYTAAGLTNGSTRYLRLTAVNALGRESAPSYSVPVTPGETPGRVFEVGPNKTYTSIGAVPWNTLAPGDMVKIHWRDTPYREKALISQSGTTNRPIRVFGVRGPQGQLPIIDGENATTSSQFRYTWDGFPPNTLWMVGRRASGPAVSNVWLEGLTIRNSYQNLWFTDGSGVRQQYSPSSSGIYVYDATNVVIRGNAITGNGNGIFSHWTTSNIKVQGNHIYGNGVVRNDGAHGVYTESLGITFEHNRFGPLRPDSWGAALKDRSAGTVIRYNLFESGFTSRVVDLVEPSQLFLKDDPSYSNTYVYGNIFNYLGETGMLHFGGDQGTESWYRRNLYFYNNTVIARNDVNDWYRGGILYLNINSSRADVRNNAFYFSSRTPGATPTNWSIMVLYGTATIGVNWISPGWSTWLAGAQGSGSVSGLGNLITGGPANDPGFVDVANDNFRLKSNSALVGRGGALSADVTAEHRPTYQYREHLGVENRLSTGANDLGAVAVDTPATPPSNTATFLSANTTMRGNWKGVFGTRGYSITGDGASGPSFAVVQPNAPSKTWALSTRDGRGLQKATRSDRIAARLEANTAGTPVVLDVNITDGAEHKFSIYCLDWTGGRQQRVEVLNADTNAVLHTYNTGVFTGGLYLSWAVRGHVLVRITPTAGGSAVVSGMFFD